MKRFTLAEAAAELTRRGIESTESDVLRAGTEGRLLICVGLDGTFYSPLEEREVDAYGWFVVPPRHLFAFETRDDEVRLQLVHTLDPALQPKGLLYPQVLASRRQLCVLAKHLDAYAARSQTKGAASKPLSRVIPKQRAQEEAILAWLRDAGLDPRSLPQRAAGKPGPKAAARQYFATRTDLFTRASFDLAWERLRKQGDISGG